MSRRNFGRVLASALEAAAAAYQRAVVVPHCGECTKPCCRLDTLVLELDWKRVRVLWRIDESRASFDRRLAEGRVPREIRAADGRYFIHGKACPAYDDARHSCRIYGQALKPTGCTDFPVYVDRDVIVADLRCEALDIEELAASIARAVGSHYRIARFVDPEFPFIVSLSPRRVAGPAPSVSERPTIPK